MMRTAPLVMALLLAGCFGGGTDYDEVQRDVHDDASLVLVQDHDHFQAAAHAMDHHVDLVGYHNGVDDSGDPNAIPATMYYTELAVMPGYTYLGRVSTDGAHGGFSILDTSVPEAPRFVSAFVGGPASDIEVTTDQQLAFLTTQRNMPDQVANHIVASQQPAGLLVRGITIVDIADKGNPTLSGFFPLPINGPHTATYVDHPDGNEYLVVSTYDLITDPGTGALLGALPVTQRVLVFQIIRDVAVADMLVPVNQFQLLDAPGPGQLFFPHDAIAAEHPTHGMLLYVAYWDQGVQILDFNNPSLAPLEVLDAHTDFAPSARNNIHQTKPFDELLDDRHITVAEPEIVAADETGYITFLDTTNPQDIQRISQWTLPGDLFVQSLEFSPHNFDTFDGKLALAHNHAGLWIIEVENDPEDPRSVGFYMPGIPRTDSPRMQPYTWGVFEHEGLLYLSDEATGLHIVEYTGP